MSVTSILLVTMTSLLAILIASAIARTMKVFFAYERFKQNARGLPMEPFRWSPNGHMHLTCFGPYALMKAEPWFRKMNAKTFGLMLGPLPLVITSDLELIKTINFTESSKHYNRSTVDSLGLPVDELEVDCITTAVGDQWRRIRKSIAPSFSKHKVNSPNVVREIESGIERLFAGIKAQIKKGVSEKVVSGSESKDVNLSYNGDVNISDVMVRYTTDLIYSCFYKQTDLVDYVCDQDPHTTYVKESVHGIQHPLVEVSMALPLIQPILQWLINHFHKFGKMKGKVMDLIREQTAFNLQARQEIAEAKKLGKEIDPDNFILSDGRAFKHNMIDSFTDSYHDGIVSTREYLHTSFFFILAGIETLADVLSEMLKYLGTHRTVQEKLRDSLMKDGTESKYLEWCINETLRLTSPVSMFMRKAERDIEVDGGIVPKDVGIYVPVYTIHRLVEYWGEDAAEFKPDRWKHADKFHPAQFMPFGGGLRICPGKELSLLVMRRIAQAMLMSYNLERCSRTCDSTLFKAPLLVHRVIEAPVYLKLSARSDTVQVDGR